MFKYNYQGGTVVEVFSAQGKDPVAKWKLHGGPSAIHKEYNKEVKGFVYCLEGDIQTVKMQIPESGKMSLGLIQRYLVLQVKIPEGKDFCVELVITYSGNMKRRLYLSTVNKELSVTPFHARIPFVGVKQNVWSSLCIDLETFISELFKGTYTTLDAITLSATCELRRIFTMKTEPAGMLKDGMILTGFGVMKLLPHSCQFPPDLENVTQLLNGSLIENLRKAQMRTSVLNSDCVPHTSTHARSASYNKNRIQDVSRTASGFRVDSGPPAQTEWKTSAPSDARDRIGRCIQNVGRLSLRMNLQIAAETQNISVLSETSSHTEPSHSLQNAPAHALPGAQEKKYKTRDKSAPPSSGQDRGHQPVTEKSEHQTTGFCSDLQVRSSWENNESKPRLTLQEMVFTVPSHFHSPRQEQGISDRKKMVMGDGQLQSEIRRHREAQLEDIFRGSESDEDNICTNVIQYLGTDTDDNPATSRSLGSVLDVQKEVHPEFHNMDQTSAKDPHPATNNMQSPFGWKAEPTGLSPKRCLALSGSRHGYSSGPETDNQVLNGTNSTSLSRKLFQEVTLDNAKQHKVNEHERPEGVDCSVSDMHLLDSLKIHGADDEELRMLASLKREQEEDECGASVFSTSQIYQSNVSVSMSSDFTSTWTHIPMPANQGHHYQKEMNPLLRSNPREWMEVLSPPIMPPSQRMSSGKTWKCGEDLIKGREESVNEEENEDDEYLNLFYDPCLKQYFDPKTGKYYELA